MSDLIDREYVIDFLKLTRDSEYEKSISAEVKHKSVIRSKHDAHVAFCDYLIDYVNQVPTHPTPSNTLGALDCVERQAAIDAFWKLEAELRPSAIDAVLDMLKNLPSVQPRKGKWIDDGTEFGCCCSECGSTLDDYFDGLTEDVRLMKIPDFCLNCGADMRGDNNGSD